MTSPAFHPAILQLLRLQSRGRRRRMWNRFCEPRRLFLSTVACVLAVAWLGNAAMTIWLREAASATTLRAILSLGLVLYAGWHVTKAAFFRPASPFDWTPAERDLLFTMPLRSRDLAAYQVASVTVTTLLKAGLFTLLLLPDLRCLPLGLVGLLLAMLLLELLRMAIDVVAWGMGRAAFVTYRVVVVAGLLAAGVSVGAVVMRANPLGAPIDAGEPALPRIVEMLVQLSTTTFGVAARPFQPFIDLVVAERFTITSAGLATVALAAVSMLAVAVVVLYSVTFRRVAERERRDYAAAHAATLSNAGLTATTTPNYRTQHRRASRTLQLWRIPRWGGAGALAWRQLLGARRHAGSLLTALIAPAVLTCIPCFGVADPSLAFVATMSTLAFYTFLLLPTALRFDFRRDLTRLATLKGLPLTPAAAAIGQTLAPVIIATLFQAAVLAFAVVARSLPAYYFVISMLVMLPLNVLVFGLDNLIYLLYPYRIEQEGLEIFLRTMLTFTGKGLLFGVALAALSVWGLAAAALTRAAAPWTGDAVSAYVVFAAGVIAGPTLLAAFVLGGLSRTYRRMNPLEDMPR